MKKLYSSLVFIFIVVIVIPVLSQPLWDLGPELDKKLEEAAEQYVLLHLTEELSTTRELTKTVMGRNWLRDWDEKRTSILKFVLFSYPDLKFKWNNNWFEWLQNFYKLQLKYFEEIAKYYDKRRGSSPWPKITFDVVNKKAVLHPIQHHQLITTNERHLVDPIASDGYIDYVLRFHRPFTDEEAKLSQELSSYFKHIFRKDKNRARKKYYIINREKIKKLQRARYKLIQDSLRGKRFSEVDYQAALFHGERIVTELDIWNKHGIVRTKDKTDDYLNMKIPNYLRLLNVDNVYQRYLNFEDEHFQGNKFSGYVNRYDDPAKHNLYFEETAESLISYNRFAPMRELANDIRTFDVLSDGFTKVLDKDLPRINSYLERFKILTFWYTDDRIRPNKWFLAPTTSNNDKNQLYVIKPKNYMPSDSPAEMFEKVKNVIKKAMNRPIYDSYANFLIETDKSLMHKLRNEWTLLSKASSHKTCDRCQSVMINRAVHSSNLLTHMISMSIDSVISSLQGQTLNPIYSRQNNRDNVDSRNLFSISYFDLPNAESGTNQFGINKAHKDNSVTDDGSDDNVDKLFDTVQDLFDPNHNIIQDHQDILPYVSGDGNSHVDRSNFGSIDVNYENNNQPTDTTKDKQKTDQLATAVQDFFDLDGNSLTRIESTDDVSLNFNTNHYDTGSHQSNFYNQFNNNDKNVYQKRTIENGNNLQNSKKIKCHF